MTARIIDVPEHPSDCRGDGVGAAAYYFALRLAHGLELGRDREEQLEALAQIFPRGKSAAELARRERLS